MDIQNKKPKKSIWDEMVAQKKLFIAVVFIMFVGAIVAITFKDSNSFGDSFGWINALFSGLAFAGLIVTLQMQREELEQNTKALEMQADELRLTREEMGKQVKEIERSAKAQEGTEKLVEQQARMMANQNDQAARRDFDDQFHRLLGYWHDVRNTFASKDINSNDALSSIIDPGLRYYSFENAERELSEHRKKKQELDFYDNVFAENRSKLAPYFTMLYRVMAHLHSAHDMKSSFKGGALFSEVDIKTKFDILRAQLSDVDRKSILMNCCHKAGGGMKPLVEKHALLKGMDFLVRAECPEQMKIILPSAFGEKPKP